MKKYLYLSSFAIVLILILAILLIRWYPPFNETESHTVCADNYGYGLSASGCPKVLIYTNIHNGFYCFIKGGGSRSGITADYNCVKK